MQIIKDKDLIAYRISIQAEMFAQNDNLDILAKDLRDKLSNGNSLSEGDIKVLRKEIERLAYLFYEMEFGNYFIKKSESFKNKVIDRVLKKVIGYLGDKTIEDIYSFVRIKIFEDLETALTDEIKVEKNAN